MKNAIQYKNTWLMPNSKAKELYEQWMKTKDPEDKKKLDNHCRQVDANYSLSLK